MFFTNEEREIGEEYLTQGYVIRPAADIEALEWIRQNIVDSIDPEFSLARADKDQEYFLNYIHTQVSVDQINNFRLKIINRINSLEKFREMYFRLAKPYLDSLVGNELAMQLRINLSIQFPGDSSSLLPVHADTWSGDSPYEVVVWVPLVDCFRTKSMYILPPDSASELSNNFSNKAGGSSEFLFQAIASDIKWLDISYGEILIFNQALPHGNRINQESETRWSMNCRFKGIFTPYGDKKLGEFFEPITLRPSSRDGMSYIPPKLI